jgi:hypothetical protein
MPEQVAAQAGGWGQMVMVPDSSFKVDEIVKSLRSVMPDSDPGESSFF